MDYLDFELDIAPSEGREYQITVVNSPAGEVRATMTFPFGQLELENKLHALEIALLRSGVQLEMAGASEEETTAVQTFLQQYFQEADINIYWGTPAQFVAELREQMEGAPPARRTSSRGTRRSRAGSRGKHR